METKIVDDDLAEMATARSGVYALLAGVFRAEPTADLIRKLRTPGPFSEALASLGISLEGDLGDLPCDQLVEDLAVEYTRLFIGPGPHLSPHESVQVETEDPSENTLWGPQTVAVKSFIELTGLHYTDEFTGLPDHISAEFEFMHKLAAREARAWEQGAGTEARRCREIQVQFLDQHLMAWVPRFCDRVAAGTESGFFREMAALTSYFMKFERELANEEANQPDPIGGNRDSRRGARSRGYEVMEDSDRATR